MRDHKNIIVTLQYNKFELTNRLLLGLAVHESENIDKIIVIDNGSNEENWQYLLRGYSKFYLPISIFPREKNEGFTLGANYGLLRASEISESNDLIFLISNDVEINGKFIKQAEEHLLKKQPSLVGNRHINFNSGWNYFGKMVFDYLEGYFLATTKSGWTELGYFDERFAPMDYEDVSLSTKARSLGYRLISLNNPNIIHQGAGTYGYTEERRKQTEKNREIFKNIWVK